MPDVGLGSFDLTQAELLGEGGEAQIFALDEAHVVRLFRQGASSQGVSARTQLLKEIAAGAAHLPYETPIVLEQGLFSGRIYTIEKRIAGQPLLALLAHSRGNLRQSLIEQYMEAAWHLGDIKVSRPFFGEIGRRDAIQTKSWQAYLAGRARRSLEVSAFSETDADSLAAEVGELAGQPAFVHLDYFAGNVMVREGKITAVIDFGYSSIIGDRRLNAVAATAHLITPRITPNVTVEDHAVALKWLRDRHLLDYYERGVPWLAAYWSFATDDLMLMDWVGSILS